MFLKIIIIAIVFLHVNAYELPQLESIEKDQPQILIFEAQSTLVKDKLSYTVQWKTANATDVHVTYLGKIAHSGEITVTEDEYNRGPITLTASNSKSDKSVSKTINKRKGGNDTTTFIRQENPKNQSHYNTMPYQRRPYARPYRRPYR